MSKVYFNGTRADVRLLAYRLRDMLVGRETDSLGIARGVQTAIGFAALSDIKDAFITKSRGGTDEMGISWAPLSQEYLAYGRRFGRSEQANLKKAAGLGGANRFAPGQNKGLLTGAQLKRWRGIFAAMYRKLALSMDDKEAKARAAQIAWSTLKAEGAQTKLDVFGHRQVDILRDTGVLLNSLSPGAISDIGPNASYSKPDNQVFETGLGRVIVGTNVPYAAVHQDAKGVKNKRRQFLPDNGAQVPDIWWQRWLAIGNRALAVGAELLFRRGLGGT